MRQARGADRVALDIRLALDQVEPGVVLGEPAFSVDTPADAVPLTSEAAYWDMDVDPGMDTGMDMDMSAPRP